MDQEGTGGISNLLQLASRYLKGQEVTSAVQQLEGITLGDLFRLLEQLASSVDHSELRRVQDLLVELAIIRDNTILSTRDALEAQLLKTLRQTGKLGELIQLLLKESIKSD